MYSRSEKELESLVQTVRVFSQDIGMKFGTNPKKKKLWFQCFKNYRQILSTAAKLRDILKMSRMSQNFVQNINSYTQTDTMKQHLGLQTE